MSGLVGIYQLPSAEVHRVKRVSTSATSGTCERPRGPRQIRMFPTLDPLMFASYFGSMEDPVIAPSALKHGLGEHEILHAYRNPIRVEPRDDSLLVIIGGDRNGDILEIVAVTDDSPNRIIHAMRARRKFLRAPRHDT